VLDASPVATPIMVLEPTTGEDVDDVDQVVTDAVWFGIEMPPTRAAGLGLSTRSGPWDGQTIAVRVARDDSVVWEDTVPGFVAALVDGAGGPAVLVLDQTGGTGDPVFAGTTLTAYEATSGELQWQHELPGTPHVIGQISGDLIAVPVGTDLHAVAVSTGDESWVAQLESAGRGGSYDLPGSFSFVGAGSADTAVAIGTAEQPYRD
jgi:hypothetical protein